MVLVDGLSFENATFSDLFQSIYSVESDAAQNSLSSSSFFKFRYLF